MFFFVIHAITVSETKPVIHWLQIFLDDAGKIEEILAFANTESEESPEMNAHFIYDIKEKEYYCIKRDENKLIRFDYNKAQGHLLHGRCYDAKTEKSWKIQLDEQRKPLYLQKEVPTNLPDLQKNIKILDIDSFVEKQYVTLKGTLIFRHSQKILDSFKEEDHALSILIHLPQLLNMSDWCFSSEEFAATIIALLQKEISAEQIVQSGLLSQAILFNITDVSVLENGYRNLKELLEIPEVNDIREELQVFLTRANTMGFEDNKGQPVNGLNNHALDTTIKKSNQITERINIGHKMLLTVTLTEAAWSRYLPYKMVVLSQLLAFKKLKVIRTESELSAYDVGDKEWKNIASFLKIKLNELSIQECIELYLELSKLDNELPLERLTSKLSEDKLFDIFDSVSNNVQWFLLYHRPELIDKLSINQRDSLIYSTVFSVDKLYMIFVISSNDVFQSCQLEFHRKILEFFLENPAARSYVSLVEALRNAPSIQILWQGEKHNWKEPFLKIIDKNNFCSDDLITLLDYYKSHRSHFIMFAEFIADDDELRKMQYPLSENELYALIIDTLSKVGSSAFDLNQCLDIIFSVFDMNYPPTIPAHVVSQIVARLKVICACNKSQVTSNAIEILSNRYSLEAIIQACVIMGKSEDRKFANLLEMQKNPKDIFEGLIQFHFENPITETNYFLNYAMEKYAKPWVQKREDSLFQYVNAMLVSCNKDEAFLKARIKLEVKGLVALEDIFYCSSFNNMFYALRARFLNYVFERGISSGIVFDSLFPSDEDDNNALTSKEATVELIAEELKLFIRYFGETVYFKTIQKDHAAYWQKKFSMNSLRMFFLELHTQSLSSAMPCFPENEKLFPYFLSLEYISFEVLESKKNKMREVARDILCDASSNKEISFLDVITLLNNYQVTLPEIFEIVIKERNALWGESVLRKFGEIRLFTLLQEAEVLVHFSLKNAPDIFHHISAFFSDEDAAPQKEKEQAYLTEFFLLFLKMNIVTFIDAFRPICLKPKPGNEYPKKLLELLENHKNAQDLKKSLFALGAKQGFVIKPREEKHAVDCSSTITKEQLNNLVNKVYKEHRNVGFTRLFNADGSKTIKNLRDLLKEDKESFTSQEIYSVIENKEKEAKPENSGTEYVLNEIKLIFHEPIQSLKKG